jgi:hypothetical protein
MSIVKRRSSLDSLLEGAGFEPSVPVAGREEAPRCQIFRKRLGEARRHELPGNIEHAQRALRGNLRPDRFDDSVADPDVAPPSGRLTWIQHIAALDH